MEESKEFNHYTYAGKVDHIVVNRLPGDLYSFTIYRKNAENSGEAPVVIKSEEQYDKYEDAVKAALNY